MASAGASASSAAVESAVKPSNSSASSLKSPGSVAFSSQPVAPVVVNSHTRRQSSDASPSWSSSNKSGGAAAATAAPVASADADEESNNKARGMRHPQQQQQQQAHSREGGSASGGGGSRVNTAPSSPYNSSSDQSETSDEERGGNKSAVHAKSSAGVSKEGQQQQQQARKSSGSSVASLPAISGAALLQLRGGGMNSIQPAEKRGDEQYEGGNSAGGTVGSGGAGGAIRQYRNRSRSRSRERPEAITGRWSNNNNNNNNDSGANPADKDVNMGGRPEDRLSFSGSSEDREMRIMFHGREIYADDLIGLRVAKTFVGHGRFLGQVVKFDEPTSLYTVVYADGDAEELNIDNTIQILIQDEIERADPSLPPVSSAYAKEVYPSRPDSPEIIGAKASGSSSQQQRSQGPPSSVGPVQGPVAVVPTPPPAQVAAVSAGPGPRALLQISEREAQFVVGLFENHALPVLLREGWKIQTSQSGTEQRFYAPQGNFPGAGRVFTSALAVVEFVASDNELLSICFPQNVHSAILSLFPESSRLRESNSSQTRKRVPVAQVEAESYDMKRQRPGRDEMGGGGGPPTSHMRPVPSGRGPPAPTQSSSQRHSSMVDQQHGYRHQSSADIVMEREREAYAADRVPPVSSERFGGSSTSSREGGRHGGVRPGGGYPEAGEYRRAPPNDSRGGLPTRGPPQEIPGSRWPSGGGGSSRSSPASNNANPDPTEYRRQYADSPEWREREMPSRGEGGSTQHYSSGPPPSLYHEGGHFRGHSRSEEPSYYAERSAPPPRMRAAVGGDVPPGSYRYQEVHSSPTRRSPSADHFHRHASSSSGRASGPSPPTADVGPPPSSRRESMPPEYRNVNAGGERMGRGSGPPPPGRGDPGSMAPPAGPPGRGPSFSMMDVDRNSNPRSGGVPSSATTLMEHSRAVASDNGQSSKWENRRSTPEHGGYEQSSERGRSSHINEPPSQAYGGSQHHQHQHHHQRYHHSHHHHQRMSSNGDNNSYMETNGSSIPDGRAPSADLVPEQQQRSASPGALSNK